MAMISDNSRDLLLLLQIIHVRGLIDPPTVVESAPKLEDVGEKWFYHKSTQLSIQQGKLDISEPPAAKDIVDTYKQLLELNPDCRNTTDLANVYYFKRKAEVEDEISQNKEDFVKLLATHKVN